MNRQVPNSREYKYRGFKIVRQQVGLYGWNVIERKTGRMKLTGAATLADAKAYIEDERQAQEYEVPIFKTPPFNPNR